MTRTRRAGTLLAAAGLAALALLGSGCGSDDAAADADGGGGDGTRAQLTVSDARIPEPAGDNAALYFTVVNEGDPVEVRSASSRDAASVVIHRTATSDEGLMEMRELSEPLTFETGTTMLRPGAEHVMLIDLGRRLAVGDVVAVDLELGDGSTLTLRADVVDVGDVVAE